MPLATNSHRPLPGWRLIEVTLLWLFLAVPVIAQFEGDSLPVAPPPPPPSLQEETSEPDDDGARQTAVSRLEMLQDGIKRLRASDPQSAKRLSLQLDAILDRFEADLQHQMPSTDEESTHSRRSKFLSPRPAFESARQVIQWLRDDGDRDVSEALTERLQDFEEALQTGSFDFPSNEDPEIHHVELARGSTLPPNLRTEQNQFSTGYAEVRVTYTSRPVILCLSANEPVLWKVDLDDGVVVQAVILDSVREQSVIGLDGQLVLNTRDAATSGVLRQPRGRSAIGRFGALYGLAGGEPLTHFKSNVWDGAPILIGPGNGDWLSARLVREVEWATEEAQREIQRRQADRLTGLRFSSTFRNTLLETSPVTCGGEFNVLGPIADTLTPLSHRQLRQTLLVGNEGARREFGLTTDARLVTVKRQADRVDITPVPLPHQLFRGSTAVQAFAYNAVRNRLLLAARFDSDTWLYALSVSSGEWTKVRSLGGSVVAMTWVPDDDRLWAVLSSAGEKGRTESIRLAMVDADGNTVNDVEVVPALTTNQGSAGGRLRWSNSLSQLTAAEGHAVLVGQPLSSNGEANAGGRIFVIDPKTGRRLYAGDLTVNDGADPPVSLNQNRRDRGGKYRSAFAEVNAKLALLRSRLADAEPASDAVRDLSRQLQFATNTLLGRKQPDSQKQSRPAAASEKRMYVVGRYSSAAPMRVRVTDASVPVVLVVCGQRKIEWKVEAAPGVTIDSIIAAGSLPQVVSDKPDGVPVRSLSGADGFALYDARNVDAVERVSRKLSELTGGLNVTAINAVHRSEGLQRVGPDVGVQRVQLVLRHLEAALKGSKEKGEVFAKIEEQRFFALHHGVLPRMPEAPNGDGRYWNEFSVNGPLIGRSKEVPRTTQFVQHDTATDRLYLISDRTLSVRELATNASRVIQLTAQVPSLGRVTGMALDAENRRLFIDTTRQLLSLDLTNEKLTILRSRNQSQQHGLAWSSRKKVLYSAQVDRSGRGEISRLQRFTARGVSLSPIDLSRSIPHNLSYGPSGKLLLVDLGDQLMLIDYPAGRNVRLMNGRRVNRAAPGRAYVIDVSTGEVLADSIMKPRLEPQSISESGLAAIWEELGAVTLPDDGLLWKMAAGGEATLDFLKHKYSRKPSALSAIDVAILIRKLDDNRFSVRTRAFEELQATGNSIESILRETLASAELSSEVRERLQSLIARWQTGVPQTPDEHRLVRGLEVMSRIGSDSANRLLQKLRGEGYEALVRRHARQALNQDEVSPVDSNPALQFQRKLWVPIQK